MRQNTNQATQPSLSTAAAHVKPSIGRSTKRVAAPSADGSNYFKAALLTYREILFDIDLEKIELQDDALCLHQRLRSVTIRKQIIRFPAHLTTNVEHREAALLNNQCTLAMALLGRLVRTLLKGTVIPLQQCAEDSTLST